MSGFLQEGWVCVHPYTYDHYVTKATRGTLCEAHGWGYGAGLRENPLDFKPTCKKCEKLLAKLLESRREDAQE